MSIRILKMCWDSLYKAFTYHCPQNWKKNRTLFLFIKNDKQSIRNYRPVSHLQYVGKSSKDYCIKLVSFSTDFMSQNQSRFKWEDSCNNQFLSVTHDIDKFLDDVWEVRSVFLNISKTFEKVRYQVLIFKFGKMRY